MSVGISNVPQLAFFPWIELARDINAGDYSLKSFVHGVGADVRGDGADSRNLFAIGSEAVPRAVRQGVAPEPRSAPERMASGTER